MTMQGRSFILTIGRSQLLISRMLFMLHLPKKEPIITYSLLLRSRYSETDKMGVVYHSRYLEYFEVIRTEFIRQAGLSYREMEELGVIMPVVGLEIRFRRPVLYDDSMEGRLLIYEEPVMRLTTWYEIRTEREQDFAVLGKVDLAFLSMETRRPMRVPDLFLSKLRNYGQVAQ